nr:unnamed protein product [Callosobruchus analis]
MALILTEHMGCESPCCMMSDTCCGAFTAAKINMDAAHAATSWFASNSSCQATGIISGNWSSVYERWYICSQDVGFRNFNVVKKDGADGYEGVALFISNKPKYEIFHFKRNFNPKIESPHRFTSPNKKK